MEWTQTFEFSMPIDRVWEAFNDRSVSAPWNHVFTGDPYFGRGAITVEEGARQAEGPERFISWSETEGGDTVQMTVTFESTETGARITLTRFGFGEGPTLANRNGGRFLGWVESMYDFALFLEYGVRRARHRGSGDGFRRLRLLGVDMVDTGAGVVAGRVNEGLARTAGMRPAMVPVVSPMSGAARMVMGTTKPGCCAETRMRPRSAMARNMWSVFSICFQP